MRGAAAGAGLVLTLAVSATWAATRQDEFPHEAHEGVFPLCTGCHVGIETGNAGEIFPEAADCRSCHDGVTEEAVDWPGATSTPSNLVFDHVEHAREVAETPDSVACATCHQMAGREERMAVTRAPPEGCITCHAHEVPEHLASEADCRSCHLAIAEAPDLDATWVEALPQPPGHDDEAFLPGHGEGLTGPSDVATCAVCHAQESCERCHLNALELPAIQALARDERIAATTRGRDGEYPEPATHEAGAWIWEHPREADAPDAGCANCHATDSCRACHQNARVAAIDALPEARPGGPTGVVFEGGDPAVHPVGFAFAHGTVAGAAEQSCAGCHGDQSFCLDCHQGPSQPEFHLGNFRERHGALAYGNETECASCHSPEVFCRECHAGSGLASEGRLNVAFHTAQPFWLLGHGQAARQRLESCTTCHDQADCVQCHSAVGAWRINPHGPDFDGARAEERNRLTCLQCHPGRRE